MIHDSNRNLSAPIGQAFGWSSRWAEQEVLPRLCGILRPQRKAEGSVGEASARRLEGSMCGTALPTADAANPLRMALHNTVGSVHTVLYDKGRVTWDHSGYASGMPAARLHREQTTGVTGTPNSECRPL